MKYIKKITFVFFSCVAKYKTRITEKTIFQTWYDFLHFMGVRNLDDVRDVTKVWFADYHGQFTTPAILATLFFSRLGIIWIINIVALFSIIHIFRRVMHQKIVHKKVILNEPSVMLPPFLEPPPLIAESKSNDCLGCVPPGLQPKPLDEDVQPTRTIATARPRGLFDYLLECC